MTTPLNTFAIISFSYGNEETTVKSESLVYKEDQPQLQQTGQEQTLGARRVVEKQSQVNEAIHRTEHTEFWVILEDGVLSIEQYPINMFVEQIDGHFAGPFGNKYSALKFINTFRSIIRGV